MLHFTRIPGQPDQMAFFVYVSNDGKVRIPRWNEKLQPHWQEPVLDEFQPLNDFSPVDPTFKVLTYRLEKIIGPKNLTQAGILWLAERIFGGPKAEVDAFGVLVGNHGDGHQRLCHARTLG